MAGLFLALLFLFPITLHSENKPSSPPPDSAHSAFWGEMRRKMPIPLLQFQSASEEVLKNHNILKYLLNQQIFQDHFFAKLKESENQKSQITPEDQVKYIFYFISNFLQILKNGSPQEIEDFMKAHAFTKSDKMLTMLILISHNYLGEKIFDLMNSSNLSVNDTLALKDINSLLLPEDLKDSHGVIAVLSHHLASTGDRTIVEQLPDKNYDPEIKNGLHENTLHSAIRLISMFKPNLFNDSQAVLEYKKSLSQIAENYPQLINEKDILGFTPLATAIETQNRPAFEVLTNEKVSTDLRAKDIANRDLKALAELRDSPYFLHHLHRMLPSDSNQGTDPNKDNKESGLVYLDLEPFVRRLTSSIAVTNPEVPQAQLNVTHNLLIKQWRHFEDIRLRTLSRLIQPYDTSSREQHLILQAILKRDTHFFQNLSKEQKELLGMPFLDHSAIGRPLFVSNFLLEAIRHSFLPAVQSVLDNYKISDLAMNKLTSLSPGPLSLSVITHASLDDNHPQKREALSIVQLVEKHTDITDIGNFFIDFDPTTWAVLLGSFEVVKSFRENREVEFVPKIAYGQNLVLEVPEYLRIQGFWTLLEYIAQYSDIQEDDAENPSTCHGTVRRTLLN